MEEKSLDQLRCEAQDLYQAKLRAYQQAQNQTSDEIKKSRVITPAKHISQPREHVPPQTEASANPGKTQAPGLQQKNSWFVSSSFLILLLVVLIELFLF